MLSKYSYDSEQCLTPNEILNFEIQELTSVPNF